MQIKFLRIKQRFNCFIILRSLLQGEKDLGVATWLLRLTLDTEQVPTLKSEPVSSDVPLGSLHHIFAHGNASSTADYYKAEICKNERC